MFQIILTGLFYGLLMAVMIGPVFFSIVQTSIHKGFFSAALLAFGIILSEAFVITLAYLTLVSFTSNSFFDEDNIIFKTILGILGGSVLLTLGIFSFFKKAQKECVKIDTRKHGIKIIAEGFFMNVLNPFVYFFWVNLITVILIEMNYTHNEIVVLFSITLITIFSTDLLKAYIAIQISKYLTLEILQWINRIVGICLSGFGFRLIYFGLLGV